MKRRSCAMLPALLTLLATLRPGASLAARDCPGLAVDSDAAFRSRWPALVERIVDEFAERDDADTCARVELRMRDHAMVDVLVTLPDGRETSRRVTRNEDIIPTLQALLLVPDHGPSASETESQATAAPASLPTTSPSPPPRARPSALDVTSKSGGSDATAAPEVRAAREFGFELSLVTGARIGDGQTAIGGGVLSFLEVKRWLIGFGGRADSYRPSGGGDAESALELAVLMGRRLDFDSVALDLTLGPAIAIKGIAETRADIMAVDGAPPPEPRAAPSPVTESSSGAVPRLVLGARLGFSPRSIFRTFVGIDGELGPARSSDTVELHSTRLPTYTVGLAVGATVGTR